jgi:hypothetical protein
MAPFALHGDSTTVDRAGFWWIAHSAGRPQLPVPAIACAKQKGISFDNGVADGRLVDDGGDLADCRHAQSNAQ